MALSPGVRDKESPLQTWLVNSYSVVPETCVIDCILISVGPCGTFSYKLMHSV